MGHQDLTLTIFWVLSGRENMQTKFASISGFESVKHHLGK